ncbi:MAG TPA: carboxypeptidase regulatory-like domain-containing protein [Bryobacteraceae bacterium]|nr:carboxypeptidase regulatory-like domain-containing protein [Bryobacteraceae bacterium]
MKARRIPPRLIILGVLGTAFSSAQTTQGLISGSIVNSVTGRPIAGASVTYTSATLAATGTLQSDTGGYYFLPLLSAGTYSVRATANGYQSQQLEQLELQVAGRIQIDFKLRPLSDVWEAGQYRSVFLPGSKTIVTFYGPDVDTSRSGSFEGQQGKRGTLDTSVSYVIDPTQIGELPLQGRDVYTMLVSLPGVTADNGTARGLGVSVAGQRPSSSNFLLDGVENNNYLVTGPLNPVAPEAVQEYRISTNNYSAEYGRTAGFVANAVTRAGGKEYHGIGYEYLKNDALNAADFQDNLTGLGRLPLRQNQYGYQFGGPVPKLLRGRLFFSSALENFRSFSSLAPNTYTLPTTNFIPALNISATRLAYQLLTKYPGPTIVSPTGAVTAKYTVEQPVEVDRLIALERGDFTTNGGRDHILGRLNIARLTEPDFLWYVYPDFTSALHQHTTGGATNWMHTWTPRLTSEFKLSYSDDDLFWARAHPEVPILQSGDGVLLPGSQGQYDYRNHNKSFEAIYSAIWTRNRHVISAGAGALFRFNSGYFNLFDSGEFGFQNVINFAFDRPSAFEVAIDRLSPTLTQPDSNRSYRYTQTYFFVQDSFRVSSRITLNYGLRYERFGSPVNTGAVKDALVTLGQGSDFNARLAAATIVAGTGGQHIYGSDNGDFAPRAGFAWDLFGKNKTLLRGGFGMFYDRPFDNLWQNVRINSILTPQYNLVTSTTNYLQPISQLLPQFQNQTLFASNFPPLIFMDPKLRNGYAETAFVGVQQSIGENLTIEVNGTASRGRRLITSDIVNRQFTTTAGFDGRPNENLPDIEWRSSQGTSDYSALTMLTRYRLRTLQLQAASTWSRSIDQQSDPFGAEVVNLQFTTVGGSGDSALRSSFAQQFNNNGDRGNSAFDQRQNLFLVGIWQSDFRRLALRGWQISWLAAFRTGFPYSVEAPQTDIVPGIAAIENQRADVVNPAAVYFASPVAAPAGRILLNAAAFGIPAAGLVGNSGRNAFRGPGLYNVDFSLGRAFAVPSFWKVKTREGTRLTFRADAFNILNHANLNNPDALVGSPTFGLATFGRQGTASGFPAVSPVNETARQIQLMVRLEF